jgi:endoglucanase
MLRTIQLTLMAAALSMTAMSQEISKFIITDQFGYLPDAKKIAVLKDPVTGFDASESYAPGSKFFVVNARTGEKVFAGSPVKWNNGNTDASSGDKAWHFDFSSVTQSGSYYILDEENNLRSYEFDIAKNVYNDVLKQAMRMFFYQRVGFAKEAPYAEEGWTDAASHIGPLQDKNCRSFFDKNNPDTEKDLSGGWYDAGDYNKYTNWTANYVVELIKAYKEKPGAWSDDYNIPESGNGLPDILDETKWGIDFLLRMQEADGGVLSIVGEASASPPSSTTGPSYYGPASTSATLNTAAALAISSEVFREQGMTDYADTLLARAEKAWTWAEANPAVVFHNNTSSNNSSGLGAGDQETDDYGRLMARLESACYLLEASGNPAYRDYFDSNYHQVHLMQWNYAYPFETENQDILLYYTGLDDGTQSVKDDILATYKNALKNGGDNLPAWSSRKDPYLSYMKDYTWGSNGVKALQGRMYYDMITFGIDPATENTMKDAALTYINYIHGVNPLAFVYLSNMYDHGAENGVNEFYHSWFTNGSPLWDRVGVSVYGPPPGFLTGGANPSYDWDGCCPGGCGSSSNNALCTSESISPPKGQPAQKSYKDFNTSWPLNSWSVTENSCGYQVNYIILLSKFVTAGTDCHGDVGGSAFIDSCGVCAGGNTGITPTLDKEECTPLDCYGIAGGTAFIDSCGICAGGTTGVDPELDPAVCNQAPDCNGDLGGTAFIDSCGICSEGNTGRAAVLDPEACNPPVDCNGDENGTAIIDSCGNCAGGNTGLDPVLDPEACNPEVDCNGDPGGTAFIDSCGICSEGNTGRSAVLDPKACNPEADCNGDPGGTAFIDSCGNCAGGNTGITPILDPENCTDFIPGQSADGPFTMYPNPNNGTIHLSTEAQGEFRIRIFTLNGNILTDKKLKGDADIDTSSFPPGYYEIVIETNTGIYRMKMIRL